MSDPAEWEALGTAYYRKHALYTLSWGIQGSLVHEFLVRSAPLAGHYALMRNYNLPVLLDSAVPSSQLRTKYISVYNSSGLLVNTVRWESSIRILEFGFTAQHNLVIISQDGFYRVYDRHDPATHTQHSLGSEVEAIGILDAKIYPDGMVIMLSNYSFMHVQGWDGATVTYLSETGLAQPPLSWALIPPNVSTSRSIEVIASTQTHGMLVIDHLETQPQKFTPNQCSTIIPSPSGRFLALISQQDANNPPTLYVVSSNFMETLTQYIIPADQATPSQIAWCGDNSVLLAFEGYVVMVGPYGETIQYYYADPVVLTSEPDGTRILSNNALDFLQKVPLSTVSIFQPGSTSPAAILYEASQAFENKSPKADDLTRVLKKDGVLLEAVEECMQSAAREFDTKIQKSLLRAASFGKNFLDSYNPTEFVELSKVLRFLNAIRSFDIGIPLSYDQYLATTSSEVLLRLSRLSHHLLSLRIATFLSLPTSPLLLHWATQKVLSNKDLSAQSENELVQEIVQRLGSYTDSKGDTDGHVGCADIAGKAFENGRTELANKLLSHEIRADKQVLLMLKMQQDNLALSKAVDSGDPDLILTVLHSLRNSHNLSNFFRFLDDKPLASSLLQTSAKDLSDPSLHSSPIAKGQLEMLRDFWYQDDRWTESACFDLCEAATTTDFGEKMAKVRNASKLFGSDKERGFEARQTEDELKLLAYQQTLEREIDAQGKQFVGLSVNETLRRCILAGWYKKADKVKSDFKVPDKRFWYVKMKALTEIRDWEGLDTFARSKRSPIGYEAFVLHLIATGNQRQATTFVQRCDARNRPDLYIRCGEWLKAGEECRSRNEKGRLMEIRQACPNGVVAAQLDALLDEMKGL